MSVDASDHAGDAESPSHLSPGFLVGGGRYTLTRQIARGGMGVVWLAHDERLNEGVALKFLPATVRADSVELARLRQETQKSRKLTHPNIIRIYDLYEAPGEPAFISMEYVNGPDLWDLMKRQANGVFTWADLEPLVKQMCDALAYAHGERVIHRDLKPSNLMLAENQRLKLADFGLAVVAVQAGAATVERHFGGGTLTHMSPQQLQGEPASVTDDLYSLGATLYDLLCGRPPFYEGDVRHQLLHDAPPPLQERLAALEAPNDVPSEVAAIIMACLAKDPAKRPQSALAVAEWIGLTAETATAPILASTVFSPSKAEPPEEEPPKSGAWRWPAIAGIAACIGLGLWLWRSPRQTLNQTPTVSAGSNTVVVVHEVPVEKPSTNAVPANTLLPQVPAIAEGMLDTTFDAGRGADGEIDDLMLQSDGGILVAGQFGMFNGGVRHSLARLKPDGQLDALRAEVDGTVYAMTTQLDGRIVIGGDFFMVNGLRRPRLARLQQNLALDPTFDAGEGPDREVLTVAMSNNGIFIAGEFLRVGDKKLSGVARLNGFGQIDPTFKIGAGANSRVLASAAQLNGKVVIGGTFHRYHGKWMPFLCRIHQDGAIQNIFHPEVTGTVHAIALQRDEKIIIGGEFDAVHSAPFKGIARLNVDGSLDPSFNPGIGVDKSVETIAVQGDGKIIIGGDFTTVNGVPQRHLARLNQYGDLDKTFAFAVAGDEVRKALIQRDGKILVAYQVNGPTGPRHANIVRFKPDHLTK